jgi:MoxR-like ATPase
MFGIKSKEERPSEDTVKKAQEIINEMKSEIGKVVVGQEEIVDSLIRALLCDGHVLLEGVPGIAKTLAIKTLAIVSGCASKRIQFTVDLLPTDITGITTYTPGKGYETIKFYYCG